MRLERETLHQFLPDTDHQKISLLLNLLPHSLRSESRKATPAAQLLAADTSPTVGERQHTRRWSQASNRRSQIVACHRRALEHIGLVVPDLKHEAIGSSCAEDDLIQGPTRKHQKAGPRWSAVCAGTIRLADRVGMLSDLDYNRPQRAPSNVDRPASDAPWSGIRMPAPVLYPRAQTDYCSSLCSLQKSYCVVYVLKEYSHTREASLPNSGAATYAAPATRSAGLYAQAVGT